MPTNPKRCLAPPNLLKYLPAVRNPMFLCMLFWDKQTPAGGAHSGNRDATQQLITDCKIVNFIPRHFFFALLSVGSFDSRNVPRSLEFYWGHLPRFCKRKYSPHAPKENLSTCIRRMNNNFVQTRTRLMDGKCFECQYFFCVPFFLIQFNFARCSCFYRLFSRRFLFFLLFLFKCNPVNCPI